MAGPIGATIGVWGLLQSVAEHVLSHRRWRGGVAGPGILAVGRASSWWLNEAAGSKRVSGGARFDKRQLADIQGMRSTGAVSSNAKIINRVGQ